MNETSLWRRTKSLLLLNETVRFSGNVYQTHNIAGFGEEEVNIGTIPWALLIIAFILGVVLDSFNGGLSRLIMVVAICGATWNFVKPKYYGLLLTLNSGDKKLFVTSDTSGLKRVIAEIYEVIETRKDVAYEMSINNSTVNGNFIQGNVGGSASFTSND